MAAWSECCNVRPEHNDVGKKGSKNTDVCPDNFIYSTILLRHITVESTELAEGHISNNKNKILLIFTVHEAICTK